MPKGLGLDWWPSKYGLGALGAPEILSGYLQVKTTFIIVNKTSFFFFFVCRDVCIVGINAMKDKTADALTQMQTDTLEYGFCILYHLGLK